MNSNRVIDRTPIPIESPRQQFLRFQLESLSWSIEIDRVTELVNIPIDRVVPMPQLPPAVMGVYNWRGEILWIIDLAKLLGVKDPRTPRRHRSLQPMMIINVAAGSNLSLEHKQQHPIGLVVDEIAEIEWCDRELIISAVPANIAPTLSKWATGSWKSIAGENIQILNLNAIGFSDMATPAPYRHN